MHHSYGSHSLWMDEQRPGFPPLKENLSADVCVIGAGIAGLTVAYFLMKEGKSVVILEAGEILSGETGRTTAHFVNALDDRYMDLEKYHGEEGSKLAAESHTKAINTVETIVQDEHIDCDFLRIPGYLFLTPGEPRTILEDELAAIHRAGLTNVTMTETSPLSFDDLGPSIRFPDQVQLHPVKYLSAIATILNKKGVRIFTHTRAQKVEDDPLRVVTGNGTVTAEHVVVATNIPMRDNVLIYSKQAPHRTYVIGLRVPKDSVPTELYWDTGHYTKESGSVAYHYVRLSPGKDDDILIAGGEDHRSGEADDMERRFSVLEQWTRTRFPMAGEIAYRWSGQVMEPYDGLGIIGRLPGHKNIFVVTGDSGNGMTHGTIAGPLIRDLILGKRNAWETLYDPGRFKFRAAGEFFRENAEVAKDLATDWLGPGDSVDGLKNEEGVVIRRGLAKIAVYKDDKGVVHERSAVCPHKGCIVRWNGFEKSWDCPCHGSRYDCTGKMLSGPSTMDLPIVNATRSENVSTAA